MEISRAPRLNWRSADPRSTTSWTSYGCPESRFSHDVITNLSEYFRIPADSLGGFQFDEATGEPGFFRFGPDVVCYGQSTRGHTSTSPSVDLYDASRDARVEENVVHLPFNPTHVIENLRGERYTSSS